MASSRSGLSGSSIFCILFQQVTYSWGVSIWYACILFSDNILHNDDIFLSRLSRQQQPSLLESLFCSQCVLTLSKSCDILNHYQTIKDVSASYDALLDLFESFESFLARLDIYTKIPSTTAITEIVVKILVELLSTISLAIQHVKQGRLSKPDSVHTRLINAVRCREIGKEAPRRE